MRGADLPATIPDSTSRMDLPAPPSDAEASAAMRRALSAGRIGTWYWDIASDAVLWDGALCAVYGLTPATAPRSAPEFLGLVIPEDRDATVRTVSHALEGAATVEHRFRASVGGRVLWIYDRAHVIRDPDARPTSVIGMCCEIAQDQTRGFAAFPGPLGEHPPVDLAAYLGTMVESLRRDPRSGSAPKVQYNATPVQCPFDRAVALGLILMELVAPVGPPPEAASRRVDIVLSVGTGSGELQIAGDRPREIGMESAAALARQIGGTLVSEGGRWRLDFPLATA
jgi:hypothetical protein